MAQIVAANTITRAAANGLTWNAYLGGSPTLDITFYDAVTTTTNGENYSDAQAGARATTGGIATALNPETYITLFRFIKCNRYCLWFSVASGTITTVGDAWADSIMDAWNNAYGL